LGDLDYLDADVLPDKRHKDPVPVDLRLDPPVQEQFAKVSL